MFCLKTFKTLLLILEYRVSLSNEENVQKATRLNIPVGVGVGVGTQQEELGAHQPNQPHERVESETPNVN